VALFRRELGTDPGQAVLDAADPGPLPEQHESSPSIATVTAGLETGLAALDAGAVDAAVVALRRAAAQAHQVNDPALQSTTLLALGSALVHGVRGRDGEGASVLLQAIEVLHDDKSAAHAHRELGYVELLRGRYDRAQRWLQAAVSLAGDDTAERAGAHAVQGAVLTDIGRHTEALQELGEALRHARAADVGQAETWTVTFIGRSRLLRREFAPAREALAAALTRARQLRWTAFVPLPESLLADVDLAEGNTDAAASAYEHAYALSLQLGDPCWEGLAARGLGLVANRRGDSESAMRWVSHARLRCVRLPDAWLWVEGYCLDALCGLAIDHRRPAATQFAADLEALATRTGMRELVARAYLHAADSVTGQPLTLPVFSPPRSTTRQSYGSIDRRPRVHLRNGPHSGLLRLSVAGRRHPARSLTLPRHELGNDAGQQVYVDEPGPVMADPQLLLAARKSPHKGAGGLGSGCLRPQVQRRAGGVNELAPEAVVDALSRDVAPENPQGYERRQWQLTQHSWPVPDLPPPAVAPARQGRM